jgi:hypothetical protein
MVGTTKAPNLRAKQHDPDDSPQREAHRAAIRKLVDLYAKATEEETTAYVDFDRQRDLLRRTEGRHERAVKARIDAVQAIFDYCKDKPELRGSAVYTDGLTVTIEANGDAALYEHY